MLPSFLLPVPPSARPSIPPSFESSGREQKSPNPLPSGFAIGPSVPSSTLGSSGREQKTPNPLPSGCAIGPSVPSSTLGSSGREQKSPNPLPPGCERDRAESRCGIAAGFGAQKWPFCARLLISVRRTRAFVHGRTLKSCAVRKLRPFAHTPQNPCAKPPFLRTASETRARNRGLCARDAMGRNGTQRDATGRTGWPASRATGQSARCHCFRRLSVGPRQGGGR